MSNFLGTDAFTPSCKGPDKYDVNTISILSSLLYWALCSSLSPQGCQLKILEVGIGNLKHMLITNDISSNSILVLCFDILLPRFHKW